MLSRISSRLTFANITATLALLFAMSGGAFAATHYLLTSTSQISPKVLKALKGHSGPAGQPGATAQPGLAGKAGAQGKEGQPGANGRDGSPWTAGGTLPSGKTETGTWAFVSNTEGQVRVPISFPIPTKEPLKSTGARGPVEFSQPHEEDPMDVHPNCHGTADNPEADPGFICIYAATLEDPFSSLGPVRTSGVVLIFEPGIGGPKVDEGTWAVTAP